MAAVLIPALELAAEGIVAAWTSFVASGAATATAGGVATVGVVIGIDHATRDNSETHTTAQTQTRTRARTRTRKRECKCPPDRGVLVTRNWNMSETSREYQARVTGFTPRTEWSFAGTDFDGFRSELCELEEAKAKYDQFFDKEGEIKYFWSLFGEPKIVAQGVKQSIVAGTNTPTQLKWYFMQPVSFRHFTRKFAMLAPLIQTVHQP